MTEDGQHDSGSEPQTTNQRMELTAVLRALESLAGPLHVHSDSTYVVNCFRDRWYEGWRSRGWRNAQKKPVANRDLWEPLVDAYLAREGEVTFTWVKAHAGNELNEIADQLAVAEVERLREQQSLPAQPSSGVEPAVKRETGPGGEPAGAPWPADRAIVVTGSRELDDDQRDELDGTFATLDEDNDVIVSGLRLGAELAGAEAALQRGIPLGVVLPYADPVRVWPAADRARFDRAVAAATWLVTLDGDPARPGPAIQARNRWLWSVAIGAIVVGDEPLAGEAETAGLGVISL